MSVLSEQQKECKKFERRVKWFERKIKLLLDDIETFNTERQRSKKWCASSRAYLQQLTEVLLKSINEPEEW